VDLLIIGNGFSIDFRNHFKEILSKWNTSNPLSWEINYPEGTELPLLQSLSHLNKALNNAKKTLPKANDFDLINYVSKQADFPWSQFAYLPREEVLEKGLLRTEIYIFLSYAYSSYDRIIKKIDASSWRWQKFLEDNSTNIIAAISFNYELLFEHILQRIGLNIYSIGITGEEHKGLFIGKPHGSIDYEVNPRDISVAKVSIPPTNAIYKNDTSLIRLQEKDLLLPRTQCELVPPQEASTIREFQWVAPIFDYIKNESKLISRCIIIGFSYSDPDKQEMNEILDTLKINTEVIIATPHPNEELIKAVKSRSLRYSGGLEQLFK
jgi:hypothetical protein